MRTLSHGRVRTHDISTPLSPCVPYDLAMSLEVAEHIPKPLETMYLHNLKCSSKRFIILSWGHPGQYGSGHVNLLPSSGVKHRLRNIGFEYNPHESRHLRERASFPWFKQNIAVFHMARHSGPTLKSS